jgi:FAD/FMN-containing dehydrogenase
LGGPGDFAVTVQAGVRVVDLAQALEPACQHLAVLPPFRAAPGTIGGLIATNAAAGTRRYRYGRPSDLLTAITAVRADGAIVRSGGFASTVTGQDLATLFADVGILDVNIPAGSPAAAVARFVPALRAELGRLDKARQSADGSSRGRRVCAG